MSCCLFSPQTNTVSFLTYCLPECPQRPPNAIKESPGLTDFPFQAFLAEAERCALWLLLCPQSPAPSVATTCRVTQRAPSLTWPGGVDAPTFECFALVWMENACLAGGGGKSHRDASLSDWGGAATPGDVIQTNASHMHKHTAIAVPQVRC